MKSYLKFLSRNKLYTVIEAVGLIVSLAAWWRKKKVYLQKQCFDLLCVLW